MQQPEISQWRILNAFRSRAEALTASTICERSTLSLRTVKTYLPKLVKRQTLQCSLGEDGKTKKYRLRDKTQFGRTLTIRNEGRQGRRSQVERLHLLGLRPEWLRKPLSDWRQSAGMIEGILDPKYPHTPSYVANKTGMTYKSFGEGTHAFSIRHHQRSMIPKATREAKALARALHDGDDKLGVVLHRYKDEDPPLTTQEWSEYKPCPNCGERTPDLPCRKCGYVGLKEQKPIVVSPH
jgi:ribosomal protein L40E